MTPRIQPPDLGEIPTPATEAPIVEPWLTADERAERNA